VTGGGLKGKVDPSQGLYLPYLAVRDAVPGLYLPYLAVRDAVPGLYLLYLAVEEVDLGLYLLCRMAREVLSLSLAEKGSPFSPDPFIPGLPKPGTEAIGRGACEGGFGGSPLLALPLVTQPVLSSSFEDIGRVWPGGPRLTTLSSLLAILVKFRPASWPDAPKRTPTLLERTLNLDLLKISYSPSLRSDQEDSNGSGKAEVPV
jgi:hypothetical protein